MPTGTTLTINGTAQNLQDPTNDVVLQKLVAYQKDGIPTLNFQLRNVTPSSAPAWLGVEVTLTINGTLYFKGDIMNSPTEFRNDLGWGLTYTAMGMRHRMDYVPFTDDNTGLDYAVYNQDATDPSYLASRAGRTIGQILQAVLVMTTNSSNLSNYGIGGYTFPSGVPTLPSSTTSDLAAMTVQPPHPCYVQGERMGDAIESFVSQYAPNYCFWVAPDGTMRFLDTRTFSNHVFTFDTDPIDPSEFTISADVTHCSPRVEVRGQPIALPVLVSLKAPLGSGAANGGLTQNFTVGSWTPSQWQQPSQGQANSEGTCSCTDTTHVAVASHSASETWGGNFWDQSATGRHGVIYLYDTSVSGTVTQTWTARIVSNTALTAGGSSTLTIDNPLPTLTYGYYKIYGLVGTNSLVYRSYTIVNSAIAAALANQFTFPAPIVNSSGNAATVSSIPVATVCVSAAGTGNPPYKEFALGFTQTPGASSGQILFNSPTYLVWGAAPDDVRVWLAVNQGLNQVFSPQNTGTPATTPHYAGTSNTVAGRTDTLVITCPDWKDYASKTQMQAYCDDVLDSVKDVIYEGSVTYDGLYEPALTMGMACTFTGASYTTGWEQLTSDVSHPGCPVLEVELHWLQGEGPLYTTTMHFSNRRAAYTAANFLTPQRTWLPIGLGDGFFSPAFGGSRGGENSAEAFQNYREDRDAGGLGGREAASTGEEVRDTGDNGLPPDRPDSGE